MYGEVSLILWGVAAWNVFPGKVIYSARKTVGQSIQDNTSGRKVEILQMERKWIEWNYMHVSIDRAFWLSKQKVQVESLFVHWTWTGSLSSELFTSELKWKSFLRLKIVCETIFKGVNCVFCFYLIWNLNMELIPSVSSDIPSLLQKE